MDLDLNLQLQIIGEMALAMLLGGLISLEREAANRPAGFRTHMLHAHAGSGGSGFICGIGRCADSAL
jgi:putative Mg2+ transporter-C (MgtC) family protein